MKNTKHASNLNPEIIKQARHLFSLIEQEIQNKSEDGFAETLAEEYGDYLKTSKGFDMLQYAFDLSQTHSEKAEYDLEGSVRFMKDDALGDLLRLVKWSSRLAGYLESKNPNYNHIESAIKMIKDVQPADMLNTIAGEFAYRSKGYREEIEKLKSMAPA